jgi:hypothetical protein
MYWCPDLLERSARTHRQRLPTVDLIAPTLEPHPDPRRGKPADLRGNPQAHLPWDQQQQLGVSGNKPTQNRCSNSLMLASLGAYDTLVKMDGARLFAERLIYMDRMEERALL